MQRRGANTWIIAVLAIAVGFLAALLILGRDDNKNTNATVSTTNATTSTAMPIRINQASTRHLRIGFAKTCHHKRKKGRIIAPWHFLPFVRHRRLNSQFVILPPSAF